MERVMVIGNGGGGKSTLSLRLSERLGLPWYEVDRVQFGPGWSRVPEAQVREALEGWRQQPRWVIDGFGPWDTIEARAEAADTLILVDHPLWVHFWWAAERQIAAARGLDRLGGPQDCPLEDITRRMFETIWRVHQTLRPGLLALVERHRDHKRVHHIQSPEALDDFLAKLAVGA